METKPLSLIHLVRQPLVEKSTPPLLLLLHGVGSNEHDLFGLAPFLDKRFLILKYTCAKYTGTRKLCLVRS